jgi:hypothetical protein
LSDLEQLIARCKQGIHLFNDLTGYGNTVPAINGLAVAVYDYKGGHAPDTIAGCGLTPYPAPNI